MEAATLNAALTAMKAPTTSPVTTPIFPSEWFKFQTCGDPVLEKGLKAATEFAARIRAWNSPSRGKYGCPSLRPRWLTMLGKSGTGKTHLARRLDAYWQGRGRHYTHPVCGANLIRSGGFRIWAQVVRELRGGDYRLTRELIEQDFLVLDDIGAEAGTQFVAENLFNILNERLGKWTVLTANLNLEGLAKTDSRIASRLLREGNVVVEMNTRDFAFRKL